MLELHILLIFMIIGAIAAIEVKDLLSSVVAVGTVGLALCMSFLILKAPDLAITQLVVEILCLVILIRATLKKDLPFSTTGRWLINTIITIIFVVVFSIASYYALKNLPPFGSPIMKIAKFYIENALSKTGATNFVSSVILDFRAYDTLGEATILFTAVTGVTAVMRVKGRKKIEEEDNE